MSHSLVYKSPRRLVRRLALPGLLAAALFGGALAYAYFSSSGTGTGTAFVGTLSAPGLSPLQAPSFNLTNLVPGDSSTQSVTVTAGGTGPNSHISLYELSPTGTLLSQVNLKIVEDGSSVLYDGPLGSGPNSGSPLAVPGTGPTGSWPSGENHSVVFTVSFATGAGDNSFQGANASVSFVWQRELP